MAKKITLQLQGKDPEEIIVDDYDLSKDYFDYVLGNVKDPNNNLVQGVLIGPNRYVRIIDVVDIRVEDVESSEDDSKIGNTKE
ncbi:hypothetical protein [Enterococcus gallinarum]|uniref:Uncharacterized protein n=1 Tax=Enterococcus gallinarum TaxID=1353 RepID=A0AAE7MNU2_ENTGA|nr:hypothetical protein [Enterococcus gallinarum]MBM6742489.1 hypothetical protein [Enterococcus gallinarum]QOG26880.1 hypothetical protein EGM181_06230 [Enterococcus gallinarum]RBT38377.1 hypothetical protein EB54_02511 [Enterococcus gallinarum]